jgi:hypothetical protein
MAIVSEPLFAVVDAAASGNNTLVAAVTGKRIRVTALLLVSAGTVNATFQSGAGGTALTGAMPLVANAQINVPGIPHGMFETAVGALLNLNLSAAIAVRGFLKYVLVE